MNGQDMKQFLDGVADLAVKAKGLDVISLPGNREYLTFNRTNGETLRVEVPPNRHRERFETPQAMAMFIKNAPGEVMVAAENIASVFVSEARVEYLPDADDGRDRAVCPMIPSPQLTWLRVSGGKDRSQIDFIRDLRITFAVCVPDGILGLIRNLKFSAAKEGYADIQQGRQSMGRSVLAEVRGEASIPEDVLLQIPLFENFNKAYRIPCALDVDAQTERFRLTPLPLALRGAMDQCLADIGAVFEDVAPVFYGSSGRGKKDDDGE